MIRIRIAPIVAVLALVAAGCGGGGATESSTLVGEYATEKQGELTDFVRVARQDERYVVRLKKGEAWVNPTTVTPFDQARLEAMLKQPVAVSFEGLGNDRVALLKFPEGSRIGAFQTQTGYAWATEFGLVEVHRR
jgi:hypothetical protein